MATSSNSPISSNSPSFFHSVEELNTVKVTLEKYGSFNVHINHGSKLNRATLEKIAMLAFNTLLREEKVLNEDILSDPGFQSATISNEKVTAEIKDEAPKIIQKRLPGENRAWDKLSDIITGLARSALNLSSKSRQDDLSQPKPILGAPDKKTETPRIVLQQLSSPSIQIIPDADDRYNSDDESSNFDTKAGSQSDDDSASEDSFGTPHSHPSTPTNVHRSSTKSTTAATTQNASATPSSESASSVTISASPVDKPTQPLPQSSTQRKDQETALPSVNITAPEKAAAVTAPPARGSLNVRFGGEVVIEPSPSGQPGSTTSSVGVSSSKPASQTIASVTASAGQTVGPIASEARALSPNETAVKMMSGMWRNVEKKDWTTAAKDALDELLKDPPNLFAAIIQARKEIAEITEGSSSLVAGKEIEVVRKVIEKIREKSSSSVESQADDFQKKKLKLLETFLSEVQNILVSEGWTLELLGEEGTGSTYKLTGPGGKVFVVKPIDGSVLRLGNARNQATPLANIADFRVRDGISSNEEIFADVLASRVALLLELDITPLVALVNIESDSFADIAKDVDKAIELPKGVRPENMKKLCSVQQWIGNKNSKTLTKFIEETSIPIQKGIRDDLEKAKIDEDYSQEYWKKATMRIIEKYPTILQARTEDDNKGASLDWIVEYNAEVEKVVFSQVIQQIDRQVLENCLFFCWITGETDGNYGNFLVYEKEDEKGPVLKDGKPLLGLEKIDNSLSFPGKSDKMLICLAGMIKTGEYLSQDKKILLNRLTDEKIYKIKELMARYRKSSEAITAFEERIKALKYGIEQGYAIDEIHICVRDKVCASKEMIKAKQLIDVKKQNKQHEAIELGMGVALANASLERLAAEARGEFSGTSKPVPSSEGGKPYVPNFLIDK